MDEVQQTISNARSRERQISKVSEKDDAFNVFGLGITSFFQLLRHTILALFYASLLALVMVCFNYQQEGSFIRRDLLKKEFLLTTLGNLRFAYPFCVQFYLGNMGDGL